MHWNLIWKSPGFVPFGAKLTHFVAKPTIPVFSHKSRLTASQQYWFVADYVWERQWAAVASSRDFVWFSCFLIHARYPGFTWFRFQESFNFELLFLNSEPASLLFLDYFSKIIISELSFVKVFYKVTIYLCTRFIRINRNQWILRYWSSYTRDFLAFFKEMILKILRPLKCLVY